MTCAPSILDAMAADETKDEGQSASGGTASERRPRTYLSRSYHLSTTQEALQLNWSLARPRRFSEARRDVPPDGAKLVRWSDRVSIICGSCRHTIGHCVAFHSDDLYGIVDDIAREPFGKGKPPSLAQPTGRKPYWLHITGDGRQALATFTCRRCNRTYQPRNAHRLGSEITAKNLTELLVS